jgi:hypothetical protein
MLEPIEHFFRGFGGRQTPYFSISKAGMKAKPALAARSTRAALRRLRRSRSSAKVRPAPAAAVNGAPPAD